MQDVNSIKNNASRSAYLHDLALALHQYTNDVGGSHCSATTIEGLTIFRSEEAMQAALQVFRPAILITIQSPEWSFLRERHYDHRVDEALFVTIGVPCSGAVPVASLKVPYVGLVMELNRAYTREVIEEVGIRLKPTSNRRASGASVLELSPQLLDCALRSVRLLDTPEAIPLLYPGIIREFCYWLLTSSACDQIIDFAMANVHDSRVLRAIRHLRGKFSDQIRVEELASAAGMSPATFHRQFKSVTSMSPLQYQKQLRLLEARRLMMTSNFNVEGVACEVGYVSASQFSREYTRMFGNPPRRDMSSCRLFKSGAPHVA